MACSSLSGILFDIENALLKGDIARFIQSMNLIFADISFEMLPQKGTELKHFDRWEGYFQSITYLVLKFIGLNVHTEVSKSKGRIDATIETSRFVYILEFKMDKPASKAIEQILEKGYHESFLNGKKSVKLVGISFSQSDRNIQEYIVENI